jgi:hypothetical protein
MFSAKGIMSLSAWASPQEFDARTQALKARFNGFDGRLA